MVEEGNNSLSSIDGCLYSKNGSLLLACPSGKTDIIVPINVTSIGLKSFSGNNLESIVFVPGTNVSMKEGAISDCSNLKTIKIGMGANIIFEINSIVFNDNREHTIYLEAPEGFVLNTDAYKSSINVVYGEPPVHDDHGDVLLYFLTSPVE